ncbi:hypothetical protein D0Z07_6350 [Hyphodiscus hymeniophilus]|uniref:Uncharacterized protein n=1 Tax=Hyphodiscus hymeniophilus TaxID=353542 RepID=A0A9P7AUD6_9HELO|nr:hypothetical protein D0Z07_6350 [Hyphodiscus hymeniophilus]
MNQSTILKRILFAPPSLRSFLIPRTYFPAPRSYSSSIQSITQPSFWTSLVPKPFRNHSKDKSPSKPKSKEWNPATFFIFVFLLIGSMSIQMIALKNTHAAFDRRSNAKIGLLREVIERIQKGEDVDVEGLLGTGDAKREKEWEEVLQEIEREDQAWDDAQSRRPSRKSKTSSEAEGPPADWKPAEILKEKAVPEKPKTEAPRGFY